jgi:hypothetical protein
VAASASKAGILLLAAMFGCAVLGGFPRLATGLLAVLGAACPRRGRCRRDAAGRAAIA